MEQPAQGSPDISAPPSVPATQTLALLLKQMRPKQWVKNLIVYTPLLFVGELTDPFAALKATGAFAAFCLVSSSIYVLNDVADVESDRMHPTKKNRPIASGRLSIKLAIAVGVLSLLIGLSLAFAVRPSLMLACIAYIALNVLYTIRLKHTPILDIFSIASGFVIRAVAGALAIKAQPSAWFLICTSLGALFLAMEKRRQELRLLESAGASHRKVLSDYSLSMVTRMESIIVPSLLTSYAIYSFNSPRGEWMMITVPIVLYGLMRYLMLSETGTITGAPEDVIWRDRPIQITVLLWVLTCALVVYGKPGDWLNYCEHAIDSLNINR